jgi:hypothetical protein
MRAPLLFAIACLSSAPLWCQTQPAPAAQQTHSSALGFSYSVPADWSVVDAAPTLPVVQQEVTKTAASDDEKKGIACAQIVLTAKHGDPASVVVVVALPFDCFGQQLTEKDLQGFAEGASEGLKNSFDIADPVYGAYMLGTHSMWIERAQGTVKGHPELKYTVETACSILKKGAACWMAMASDDQALKTFEHGAVTLDGESPVALVPADAFTKKPS